MSDRANLGKSLKEPSRTFFLLVEDAEGYKFLDSVRLGLVKNINTLFSFLDLLDW
jgi:hypothetical protein